MAARGGRWPRPRLLARSGALGGLRRCCAARRRRNPLVGGGSPTPSSCTSCMLFPGLALQPVRPRVRCVRQWWKLMRHALTPPAAGDSGGMGREVAEVAMVTVAGAAAAVAEGGGGWNWAEEETMTVSGTVAVGPHRRRRASSGGLDQNLAALAERRAGGAEEGDQSLGQWAKSWCAPGAARRAGIGTFRAACRAAYAAARARRTASAGTTGGCPTSCPQGRKWRRPRLFLPSACGRACPKRVLAWLVLAIVATAANGDDLTDVNDHVTTTVPQYGSGSQGCSRLGGLPGGRRRVAEEGLRLPEACATRASPRQESWAGLPWQGDRRAVVTSGCRAWELRRRSRLAAAVVPTLFKGLGVQPVVQIDGARIGSGAPGPISRRMREIYVEEMRKAAI